MSEADELEAVAVESAPLESPDHNRGRGSMLFPGEQVAYQDFCRAARILKAAEIAFKDAQRAYADAVAKLSDEAVK